MQDHGYTVYSPQKFAMVSAREKPSGKGKIDFQIRYLQQDLAGENRPILARSLPGGWLRMPGFRRWSRQCQPPGFISPLGIEMAAYLPLFFLGYPGYFPGKTGRPRMLAAGSETAAR
jgi:hypothetical protein